MKYDILKNTVRIYDITLQDIKNLLKCNCKMKIVTRDLNDEVIDFIYLLDRTDAMSLVISIAKNAIKKEIVSYSDAYQRIQNIIFQPNVSNIYVVIDKALFESKQIIFSILPSLTEKVRNGLISINYENETFLIKAKDDSGFIISIYFWVRTKDLYAFAPQGIITYIVDEEHPPKINSPEDCLKLLE